MFLLVLFCNEFGNVIPNQPADQGPFNNSKSNPPLLNDLVLGIFTVVFGTEKLASSYFGTLALFESEDSYLLQMALDIKFLAIFVPLLFYSINGDIRKHILVEFLAFIYNFVQRIEGMYNVFGMLFPIYSKYILLYLVDPNI